MVTSSPNQKDIANAMAETISQNSSSTHYTPRFQRYKRNKKEKEDFEPLKDLVIKKTISLVKCEDIGNENKQNDTASQQTEIESQCQEEKDQIKMEPK